MKIKYLTAIVILAASLTTAQAADKPVSKPATKQPAKKTISIVSDEWCPYVCNDKNKPGFFIEVASEVFTNAGYKFEYTFLPWQRALDEANKGNFDGVAIVNKVEGADFLLQEEPLGITIFKFFVKAGNKWRYKDIKSLESITLGVMEDIDYGMAITDYVEKNKHNPERIQTISAETTFDKNVKKVLAGRIDAFFEDKFVLGHYLKQHGMEDKIVDAGTSVDPNYLDEEYLYIGFSKKKPDSKAKAVVLSNGIKELRKSGKLKIILDKYGVTDWNDIKTNAKQFVQ